MTRQLKKITKGTMTFISLIVVSAIVGVVRLGFWLGSEKSNGTQNEGFLVSSTKADFPAGDCAGGCADMGGQGADCGCGNTGAGGGVGTGSDGPGDCGTSPGDCGPGDCGGVGDCSGGGSSSPGGGVST